MTALISSGPFFVASQTTATSSSQSKGLKWPKQDLIKYAVFVNHNRMQISEIKEDTNDWKFCNRLSLFVQTKNANQCRIFHKKMLDEHGTMNRLLIHLRSHIDRFQEWCDMYETSLINLNNSLLKQRRIAVKQLSILPAIKKQVDCLSEISEQDDEGNDLLMKKELKPTDTDYPKDIPIIPKKISNIVKINKTRPSVNFSLVDDKFSSKPIESNTDFMFFNPSTPTPNCHKKQTIQNEKDSKQWFDCHYGLLNYMSKLNGLMREQSHD